MIEMAQTGGAVNLDWIRHYEGSLGIGAHSVADNGAIGFLTRDPVAFRTYRLIYLQQGGANGPEETKRAGFTLETVQRAECPPEGDCAYVLTENDVYFVRQDRSLVRRSSLQARHGDLFLDLKSAGSDPKHSAVVLTQDRASTSFSVTYLEAEDSVKPFWSKAWSDPVACTAISCDGNYVAVGQKNGNITLINRQKRVVWVYSATDEHAVLSMALDQTGNVFAIDSSGALKRHEFADGSITWRISAPVGQMPLKTNLSGNILCVDGEGSTVFCCSNTLDDFAQTSHSSYIVLKGSTGVILFEEKLTSAATGAAISPSGNFASISCRNGDLILMRVDKVAGKATVSMSAGMPRDSASELLVQANRAYHARNFPKALSLVHEIFHIEPALIEAGALYDDISWNLRESVMSETRSISHESLAKVESALELLPHDEKLTIRRNALARLLAESLATDALELVHDNQHEAAMAKYVEALQIDRSQTEIRHALRSATDQLSLLLLKDADAAFHEERFTDAIDQLERVLALRPGEPAIIRRLDHAKGLKAYTTGMRHYINKRYHEAGFWFRNTLAILPDHADAARYLAFADNFSRQAAPAPAPTVTAVANAAAVETKKLPKAANDRFGMLE